MLEAAIVLQLALGEYIEAAAVAGLLVFNAVLGFFQEGRAQKTLAALKSRLALTATVRRNDAWTILPAADLVPGDVVKLSLGAVVAADVRLAEGSSCSIIRCSRANPFPLKLAQTFKPMQGPWYGEARRSRSDGDRTAHEVRPYRGACS